MKEKIISYKCDNCGNKVKVEEDNFPHYLGWLKLNRLDFSIAFGLSHPENRISTDMDFCAKECLINHIKNEICYEEKNKLEEIKDKIKFLIDEKGIYKEVMEKIGIKYYEMQNFDFGEFSPEDENHFMQIYEEFLDGIQHKREMSPKKIIELAVEYTLKLTQTKSYISYPNKIIKLERESQ